MSPSHGLDETENHESLVPFLSASFGSLEGFALSSTTAVAVSVAGLLFRTTGAAGATGGGLGEAQVSATSGLLATGTGGVASFAGAGGVTSFSGKGLLATEVVSTGAGFSSSSGS